MSDSDDHTPFAQALITLLHGIEPLKHIPRTGWVDREIPTPESVAAHSWRLAMIAWFAAAEEGLDADQALRLALVHDLPEAITGDGTPFDYLDDVSERIRLAANPSERSVAREADTRDARHERERSALAELVANAPVGIAEELSALWEEYTGKSSPEARLVHQLDKVEAYLQGWEYAGDGRLTRPLTLRSFRDDSGRMASAPTARALFLAIERWARADERLADQDATTLK